MSLILIGIALTVFEGDVLYRVQAHSLFLHTPLFFQQCLVTPGGLLGWAGAYLTQYFYYPALGATILCLCWALMMGLLIAAFRIPARLTILALVPVALLLITDVDLGYWIFYLKLRGYFYVGTLGTMAAAGLVWLYRRLEGHGPWAGFLFAFASAGFGYPLFGYYGLLGTLLIIVIVWRIKAGGRERIATAIGGAQGIVLVPIACYYLIYHETNIVNIYWVALPTFRLYQTNCPTYYIPYTLLTLWLIGLAAVPRRAQDATVPGRWSALAAYGLGLGLVLAVGFCWCKDGNFHRELRMSRAIDVQAWEKVIVLSDTDHPTRAICMMRNLALFRLGRQGDEMYHYPDGDYAPASPFPIRLVQTEGKALYLHYGLTNFCYRWCIEDGVEYGWTAEGLELMTKCALLNGEQEAVRKYISLLRKTTFHRQGCLRYEAYLRNPRLMLRDVELGPILTLLKHDDDYLTSDNADCEQFMINHFASAESRNPLYQELTLLAALQLRNRQVFWHRFYQYTELHPEQRAPLHYQEAACLFGRLSEEVDTSRMPFDRQVIERCDAFLAALAQHQGQAQQTVAQALYAKFHDTYFYHYFFN